MTDTPANDEGPTTGQQRSEQHAEHAEHAELVDPGGPGHDHTASKPEDTPTETISEPGKVMRIGSMVKQLLDEVKAAPLDAASRERLAAIYQRSIDELMTALSPDLQGELRSMALPFNDGEVPSDAELRIAQAQLVGWLEGLFHGIQAMLMAQQMAARQQLEQMRQLPPGAMRPGMQDGMPMQQGPQDASPNDRPGTYL